MKTNRTSLFRVLMLVVVFSLAVSLTACKATAATEPPPTPTPLPPTATPAPGVTTVTLDGATVTASGLQYLEITPGTGKFPEDGDIIYMRYIASLPDGTVMVDTFTSGEKVNTVVGKGILLPGWEEGLRLMKVGGRSKFVIPPDLAFGETGSGNIPANSQIIIEMELLSSEPAPMPTEVAENKLTTTASGLKYYDIKEGEGPEAVKNATVSTIYTIWVKTESGYDYIGAADFDSPLEFVVGSSDVVFAGWSEGMIGVKPGGKRLLIVPPDLALGDQEYEGIPANSTLVLEVGLISVQEPQVAAVVAEKDYTVTESGLKYYDLVQGSGETPLAGQTVVVHYTGWLEDGTVFDSSVGGDPFSFVLGQGSVIAGWDEGVATMKVGTKRQLVIPAELGYGAEGAGGVIPGGATLIFEVELLEIQK